MNYSLNHWVVFLIVSLNLYSFSLSANFTFSNTSQKDVFIAYLVQHLDHKSDLVEGIMGDVQILTPEGPRCFSQLQEGNLVFSKNYKLQAITFLKKSYVSKVYDVQLASGQIVTCGCGQRFFEHASKMFKQAAGLIIGDLVGECSVVSVNVRHGYFEIYALTTIDHTFMVYPNIVAHNMNIATAVGPNLIIGTCRLVHGVLSSIGRTVSLVKYAYYLYGLHDDVGSRAQTLVQILEDQKIVEQTRIYYQTRSQQLTELLAQYEQLRQIVIAVCKPTIIQTAVLMTQSVQINHLLNLIPDFAVELSYAGPVRQQLLECRQKHLLELEQKITSIQIGLIVQLQDQYDQLNDSLLEFQPLFKKAKAINLRDCAYKSRSVVSSMMVGMLFDAISAQESLRIMQAQCLSLKILCQFYQHPQNALLLKQSTNLLDVCLEITQKTREIESYLPEAFTYLSTLISAIYDQGVNAGLLYPSIDYEIRQKLSFSRNSKTRQANNQTLLKKSNCQFSQLLDDPEDEDKKKKRTYTGVSYHHQNSRGGPSGGKSPPPKDGQRSLDNPIAFKEKGNQKYERRLGVEEDYFVIFDEQSPGEFHGHTSSWGDLKPDMQNALYEAGIVKNIKTGKR